MRQALARKPISRGSADAKTDLQVLDRAFRVLGLFTPEHLEWTVTEVAVTLGLPPSTTHRVLGVLLQHSFVRRDSRTKRFRLGIAAVDLGVRGRASLDAPAVFRDALQTLSKETGETAILCTLDATGGASYCVERVESDEPLRLSVQPGRTLPLHAGAMGKALLAFLPREHQERVLARRLEKLCTGTITSRTRLRAELGEITARGYSTSFEETNRGAWGVAVPILDYRVWPYASVGTAGPLLRYSASLLARDVRSCREAAAKIAGALGLTVGRSAGTQVDGPVRMDEASQGRVATRARAFRRNVTEVR